MTREAILYAAKSTADVHGSIPTQLKDGRDMASKNNWPVAGEYHDEKMSAFHGNRGPGLANAMAHAERIKGVLIVQHTDRLARGDGINAQHLVEIYLWASRAGVSLRSVQDDSTLENLLMAAFMGERNHEDSRRKGLAVAAGMRRRWEKGLTTGHRRPLGYELYSTPETKSMLRPIPAEVTIVRRIFNEADAGKSNMAIARGLQADHIPTVNRSRYWRPSTIQLILKNRVYIGEVTLHDEHRPGIHQAIIDRDQFERVAVLREARRKSHSRGRGRPTAGSHLLTRGLLTCHCGDAMSPRTIRNRRGDRFVYQCLRHWHNQADCDQQYLDATEVDKAVFDYFERLGFDLDTTRTNLAAEQNRQLTEIDSLLTQAMTEETKAADRLARVKRDYTDGQITAADWKELRVDLEEEQAAAASQVERLTAKRTEIEANKDAIDTETQLVERLTEIRQTIAGRVNGAEGLDAVRAALRQTFEHFTLRRTPTGPIPGDLAWAGTDQLLIEPVIRQDAIDSLTTIGRPQLRRQTVHPSSKTNDTKASGRSRRRPEPAREPGLVRSTCR